MLRSTASSGLRGLQEGLVSKLWYYRTRSFVHVRVRKVQAITQIRNSHEMLVANLWENCDVGSREEYWRIILK
jgi:hypothetical protein